MICTENPELKCGGGWRNSVYRINRYEGEEKEEPKCPDLPPKDCSTRGGLDESDKCKQTCKKDKEIAQCYKTCFVDSAQFMKSRKENSTGNGLHGPLDWAAKDRLKTCLSVCKAKLDPNAK